MADIHPAIEADATSGFDARHVLVNTLRQIIIECTESPNRDEAKLEAIESHARAALKRCGLPAQKEAMPTEPVTWPEWTALRKKYVHLMAVMEERFRSGNAVPVERAHLSADDWGTWQAYEDAAEELFTSMAFELSRPQQASEDTELLEWLGTHNTMHVHHSAAGWSVYDQADGLVMLARNCGTMREALKTAKAEAKPVAETG